MMASDAKSGALAHIKAYGRPRTGDSVGRDLGAIRRMRSEDPPRFLRDIVRKAMADGATLAVIIGGIEISHAGTWSICRHTATEDFCWSG